MPTEAARTIKTRGFRRDTPGLLLTGWPTHVVAISGPDGWENRPAEITVGLAQLPSSNVLSLRFEDTPRPKDQFAPTLQDVVSIHRFAAGAPQCCRLLCICPGGFGRSGAATWLSWVTWGLRPEEGLEALLADRPEASPNRLMIAMSDVVLGQNGRFWQAYAQWMLTSVGVSYDPPIPVTGRAARRMREDARTRCGSI